MKHSINILNSDYVNNPRPEIHIFGRDSNYVLHHLIIINFKPYFFINEIDYLNNKYLIDNLIQERDFVLEKTDLIVNEKDIPVYKLIGKIPSDIKDFRVEISEKIPNTYEADVLFLMRFIIDNKLFKGLEYDDSDILNIYDEKYIDYSKIKPLLQINANIKFLTLDIETYDLDNTGSKKYPAKPITALSFYNEYNKVLNQFVLKNSKIINKEPNKEYRKITDIFKLPREYTKYYYDDVNLLLKTNKKTFRELNNFIENDEYFINIKKDERYINIIINTTLKLNKNEITEIKKTKKSIDELIPNDLKVVEFEYDDEVNMLKDIVRYLTITDWDIMTAFNGNDFDFPYLFGRMQILRIDFSSVSPMNKYTRYCAFVSKKDSKLVLKGKTFLDSLDGLRKLTQSELTSYSLNFVSYYLFNVTKVKYKYKTVAELYKNDYPLFKLYNKMDAILEYSMIKEKKMIWFFYFVKTVCGVDLNDVMFNTRIVDSLFLRKARERGEVLPSKVLTSEESEEKLEKIEGATVVNPTEKLMINISVYDIEQSYPSGSITVNLGAKKFVLTIEEYERNKNSEEVCGINKKNLIGAIFLKRENRYVYITKDKKGIIADLFAEMKLIRKELKKIFNKTRSDIDYTIQEVFKFIVNTVYGALLYPTFRLFDKINASIITEVGRESIDVGKQTIEKKLKRIVNYGDTDSLYSKSNKIDVAEIVKEGNEAVEIINKELEIYFKTKYNVDFCDIKFEFEKVYKKLIFKFKKDSKEIAKKMYAGSLSYFKGEYVDKIDIKGLIKSDIPEIAIDMRNIIFEKILSTKTEESEIKNILIKKLRNMFGKVKNLEYEPKYIAFAKGISSDLDEYTNQDWIRGARWTNANSSKFGSFTNYGAGSKPKFIYIDSNKITKLLDENGKTKYDSTDIIALDEDDEIPDEIYKCLNIEKTIDALAKKVDDILELTNIRIGEIISDVRNKGLGLC